MPRSIDDFPSRAPFNPTANSTHKSRCGCGGKCGCGGNCGGSGTSALQSPPGTGRTVDEYVRSSKGYVAKTSDKELGSADHTDGDTPVRRKWASEVQQRAPESRLVQIPENGHVYRFPKELQNEPRGDWKSRTEAKRAIASSQEKLVRFNYRDGSLRGDPIHARTNSKWRRDFEGSTGGGYSDSNPRLWAQRTERPLFDGPGKWTVMCPSAEGGHKDKIGLIASARGFGSGMLVGPGVVLTATHVIPWTSDGFDPDIRFYPHYCADSTNCSPHSEVRSSPVEVVAVRACPWSDGESVGDWNACTSGGCFDWAFIVYRLNRSEARRTPKWSSKYFPGVHPWVPQRDSDLLWLSGGHPGSRADGSPWSGVVSLSCDLLKLPNYRLMVQTSPVRLQDDAYCLDAVNGDFLSDDLTQYCQCAQVSYGGTYFGQTGYQWLQEGFGQLELPPDAVVGTRFVHTADQRPGISGGPFFRNFGTSANPDIRVGAVHSTGDSNSTSASGGIAMYHAWRSVLAKYGRL